MPQNMMRGAGAGLSFMSNYMKTMKERQKFQKQNQRQQMLEAYLMQGLANKTITMEAKMDADGNLLPTFKPVKQDSQNLGQMAKQMGQVTTGVRQPQELPASAQRFAPGGAQGLNRTMVPGPGGTGVGAPSGTPGAQTGMDMMPWSLKEQARQNPALAKQMGLPAEKQVKVDRDILSRRPLMKADERSVLGRTGKLLKDFNEETKITFGDIKSYDDLIAVMEEKDDLAEQGVDVNAIEKFYSNELNILRRHRIVK